MAATIPSIEPCCTPCESNVSVAVPGPQGPAGADGTNGTNGVDAFTTANSFVMPAQQANVTLTVLDSTWMFPGQIVEAGKVLAGAFGFFEVQSKPDATHVILKNLANTATSAYLINSVPTTIFPALTSISPGGVQGPPGTNAAGSAPDTASYITRVVEAGLTNEFAMGTLATGIVKNTTATGVPTIAIDGTDYLSPTTGLRKSQNLADVANAGTSRTNLGLGTVAVKDSGVADTKVAPVDKAAGLINGDVVFATAAGIETKTAAAARAALGITSFAGYDMLLYRDERATTVDSSGFAAASWETVPINTEVVDTGNHGSIAVNQVTLDAGTYRYRYAVCCSGGVSLQGRLYNVSDAAVITNSYGTVVFGQTSDTIVAPSEGRFTLAASKTIRMEAQRSGGGAATFGDASSFGGPEIYSFIELWKE